MTSQETIMEELRKEQERIADGIEEKIYARIEPAARAGTFSKLGPYFGWHKAQDVPVDVATSSLAKAMIRQEVASQVYEGTIAYHDWILCNHRREGDARVPSLDELPYQLIAERYGVPEPFMRDIARELQELEELPVLGKARDGQYLIDESKAAAWAELFDWDA